MPSDNPSVDLDRETQELIENHSISIGDGMIKVLLPDGTFIEVSEVEAPTVIKGELMELAQVA